MKRLVLSLIATVVVAMGIQAQHITIHKSNGDSIQWNIHDSFQIKTGTDGKPVWIFDNTGVSMPQTSISDISTVKMHTQAETEQQVRQALIEFYHAMDGPNWFNKDNWLSDLPVSEWYGIETEKGWVRTMRLNLNNLSGTLPACILRMGPISNIELGGNQIDGIPEWLTSIYSLHEISFGNMGLTILPEKIFELPLLKKALLRYNNFTGPIPESVTKLMDNPEIDGTFINLGYNKFTSIPDVVKNHPRFGDFWPGLLSSNPFTIPIKDANDNFTIDIPAPVFSTKDIDGKSFNTEDIYKNNKYTLIIKWSADQDISLMNNIFLAYNQLHSDTEGEGLGVIALYYQNEEGVDVIRDYMTKKGITGSDWVNSNWDDWTEDYYNFLGYGLPLAYHIVDNKGKIVWSSLIDAQGRGVDDDNYDINYQYTMLSRLETMFGKQFVIYQSTDFSMDGEVIVMQAATEGQGVDIVFVGDGFVDKDMEMGGHYEKKMYAAMEQFFSYEPYKSLRNRFNVYMVKAVSRNAEHFVGADHAIDENVSKALEYAQKVDFLKPNAPIRVNVVYNYGNGGRSYCTMFDDKSYVAFCMDGVSNVLNHECGGHGIGQLHDEYVEQGYDTWTLPDEAKALLEEQWLIGRGANVDYHPNPTEVKWAKFINDARYDTEGIGVFEGSWLYGHGAYRPTENSMMRNNDIPFNAPSREAIYKNVMQESEGVSWTYDYETFVTFDAVGHTEFVNALNNASRRAQQKDAQSMSKLTAPPVFIKGTWRDALKK